ncbi:MAG: chemotaxis protein CheW [Rhodocyclaceae bacterium]|nr:chemotaxis protein CheW [Rhodocyclaceae bacterium]
MLIDMSQFHQVFFEETAEHLATMENLLLTLDIHAPDAEQLNAIFRAAHSIKGSAGTFGFTDLSEVTHVLESLLDRIRKGELRLSEEMIDTFLDAGDVLKTLLDAHQRGADSDPSAVKAICARLERLATAPTAAGAAPPAPALPGQAVTSAEPSALHENATTSPASAGYELSFALEGDVTFISMTFDNLVAELSGLGEVEVLARPAAAGETARLRVKGPAEEKTIRELLEFVAKNDSILIEPLAAASPPQKEEAYGFFEPLPAPAATPAAEEEAYGFFTPLPQPATEAYGFFVEPSPPAAPAAPPMAKAEEAKPAPPVKPAAETSIRVGVDKVDQLINLVGELVITQAMLQQSAAHCDPVQFERLFNGLAQLERNTRDLQEAVLSIRMLPMSVVFARFPRVVRELSHKLGKQVELITQGEETELDKGLVERLTDPLTHLVRNSLDHGIETPEERIARGKPPTGTVTLSAYHQSGNIVIEVSDDGAGLDRAKILAKAKERGLPVHEAMSDQEVWQLIFEPGFSTAAQVTEVSGRGVGMDVVKKNIGALGGRVDIHSEPGVGTRMTVRLPLTLAILDGMSVAVGRETYILPLGYVIESLVPERHMIKSVSGVARLLQLREEYLPVIVLAEVFRLPHATTTWESGIMIVLEADGKKAALFVDALIGQHQVVIKSLESNYRRVAGISAATIMGDGRVALILDIPWLVGAACRSLPAAA